MHCSSNNSINAHITDIKHAHLHKANHNFCPSSCITCFICHKRRPLLLLDDFCEHAHIIFAHEFRSAPMQARHSDLTIILLSQSVNMIPSEFISNTQVKIFTSISLLSMYLSKSSVVMTLQDKKRSNKCIRSWKGAFQICILVCGFSYSSHTIDNQEIFIFNNT